MAADLAGGKIGAGAIREIFGVALDPAGEVDVGATRALRLAIRGQRIGRAASEGSLQRVEVHETGMPLNEYLQACDEGIQCTWCGEVVCGPGERWKDAAARRELPPSAGGLFRESLDAVVLRQFSCPSCGTLLETEAACAGDPPVHDEVERWARGGASRRDARAAALPRRREA